MGDRTDLHAQLRDVREQVRWGEMVFFQRAGTRRRALWTSGEWLLTPPEARWVWGDRTMRLNADERQELGRLLELRHHWEQLKKEYRGWLQQRRVARKNAIKAHDAPAHPVGPL